MPSSVHVRRLVNPTEAEIEECAIVLLKAFNSVTYDHFGVSLTGGDHSLDIYFNRSSIRAGLVDGEVWVAGHTPTDILAVAVWFGPGKDYLATEEQRASGWNDTQARFPPELQQWWSEYLLPRFGAWKDELLGKEAKINTWELQFLGTHPDHHRKGFAGALMQAIESKAAETGTMMCLETTNDPNIAFYKKRGFVVRGSISMVGAGGETIMTCLTKQP